MSFIPVLPYTPAAHQVITFSPVLTCPFHVTVCLHLTPPSQNLHLLAMVSQYCPPFYLPPTASSVINPLTGLFPYTDNYQCPLARAVVNNESVPLRIALLNSILNKSFLLNVFLTSKGLDFLFLTETWQRCMDFGPLIELCPPDCTLSEL